MASFRAGGIDWYVHITIGAVKQIKDVLGVDFLSPSDAVSVTDAEESALTVADMVGVVCQWQMILHRLSPAEFGELFAGQVIDDAREALLESLVDDFLPEYKADEEPKRDPTKPVPDTNWWREIHRMAGRVGVDPAPFTFRELLWADEGRVRHDWAQTCRLEALHRNINRAKGKRGVTAQDVAPIPLTDTATKSKPGMSVAQRLRSMSRRGVRQGERLDGK